jgi:hypothetical protein
MRALLLNCTLKPAPAESNTEALARVVMDALAEHIGFTIPGHAWTCWNKGPGPGPPLPAP